MLQVENRTPFAPAIAVFPNREGIDTLYVVVKATFNLHPRLAIADKPIPPVLADEYWGDPQSSSLKYASELHIGKQTTDVVLVGKAWTSTGRPVAETVAAVSVAGRQKVIRVVGDRFWKRSGFTEPKPFESLPLIFERAFGGQHLLSPDGPSLAEERNPIGVGFLGKRSSGEMVGQKLPNLEDPAQPLDRLGDTRTPACFGYVAPSWLPRRTFAGTYDQAWQRNRAPYLPADFSPRFFNAAAPELTMDRFLVGGEPVQVSGCSPQGPLRFEIPRCRVQGDITFAGAHERPPFKLETVLVEPEDNRVCISWRAELPCDKKVLKVEKIVIEADGIDALASGPK